MSTVRVFTFVAALGALFASIPAEAQTLPPQPHFSVFHDTIFAARVNPLGLIGLTDVTVRYRLYEHDSDVLSQNFLGLGLTAGASPAWARIGLRAEVQPLTILTLYVRYQFVGYFGTFNLFQSFRSANENYSDSALRDLSDSGDRQGYRATGSHLTLGANFQIKLGPIAVRNLFRAYYTESDMRDGDIGYYDQLIDTLMPNRGWVVVNDVDVLGLIPINTRQLAIGARYTYTHAFYRDDHLLEGQSAPDNDIHRVGLLAALQLSSEPPTETTRQARFDKPTLILLAQWHLKHLWRTGEDVSAALPYIGVAFRFQGDLLGD